MPPTRVATTGRPASMYSITDSGLPSESVLSDRDVDRGQQVGHVRAQARGA